MAEPKKPVHKTRSKTSLDPRIVALEAARMARQRGDHLLDDPADACHGSPAERKQQRDDS